MANSDPHTGKHWTTAYVGVGANLGDAGKAVQQAATQLAQVEGIRQLKLSPLYCSAPIDASGPHYINAVARFQTLLAPEVLLDTLPHIEQLHGRARPYPNAPRTLDLDLLLYGEQYINSPRLEVPHPRMHLRAFVLRPLLDLTPDIHVHGKPCADWVALCADQVLHRLPSAN